MARRYFCPWFLLTLLAVWLAPISISNLSASAAPCTTARSCSTNHEETYLEPDSRNTPATAIEVESVESIAQWQDESDFEQPNPLRAIDIGQTTRLLTRLKLWLDHYDRFFLEEAAP